MTNFPFRYPHIHPYLPHYPTPTHPQHPLIGPGGGPPPPLSAVFRNEINETITHLGGGGSPPPATAITSSLVTFPGSNHDISTGHYQNNNSDGGQQQHSTVLDWSNDWHPIIMNSTMSSSRGSSPPPPPLVKDDDGRDMGTQLSQQHSCPNCTSSLPEDHVNNEIDSGERRQSRQLGPIMLLPLSRAIQPRPVVLRTSRHMVLSSGGDTHPPHSSQQQQQQQQSIVQHHHHHHHPQLYSSQVGEQGSSGVILPIHSNLPRDLLPRRGSPPIQQKSDLIH